MTAFSMSMGSCSKDDDEPADTPMPAPEEEISNDMSQLSTPAFSEESAKYTLAPNSEGIQSIEITESGIYHIVYGYNYRSDSKSSGEKNTLSARVAKTLTVCLESNDGPSSRYGGGISIGKVIKIADGEYILEGYGTITVSGDSDNVMEIILNPQDGESVTVGAQKEDTYSLNDAATKALCRTWNPAKIHMRIDLNGATVADQSGPYSDYVNILRRTMDQFIAAMKSAYGAYVDDEDFEDIIGSGQVQTPTMVLFSRSGSYLVEYTNDYVDVRQWKWLNIANQTLRYSYDLDDLYADDSSDCAVKFNGKNAIIHSMNSMSDSDEGITVTITSHVWETLTER